VGGGGGGRAKARGRDLNLLGKKKMNEKSNVVECVVGEGGRENLVNVVESAAFHFGGARLEQARLRIVALEVNRVDFDLFDLGTYACIHAHTHTREREREIQRAFRAVSGEKCASNTVFNTAFFF
jgi:hypothetical protein